MLSISRDAYFFMFALGSSAPENSQPMLDGHPRWPQIDSEKAENIFLGPPGSLEYSIHIEIMKSPVSLLDFGIMLDFNNTYLCPCDDLYIHVIGVNMLYIYELYRQVQMIHICSVYIMCGCTIYMYMVNACRIYMLWTYRDVCKLRDVQHEYMQEWPLPQPLQ